MSYKIKHLGETLGYTIEDIPTDMEWNYGTLSIESVNGTYTIKQGSDSLFLTDRALKVLLGAIRALERKRDSDERKLPNFYDVLGIFKDD